MENASKQGRFRLDIGKISSPKVLLSPGRRHPWKELKDHFKDGLRGLFQPEKFHNSVFLLDNKGSLTSCGKHSEPLAANFGVKNSRTFFLCFAGIKFQN